MNFGIELRPKKSPIEVIKEGSFGGTDFRGIYSNVNNKWYKNSSKEFEKFSEFNDLKNINPFL